MFALWILCVGRQLFLRPSFLSSRESYRVCVFVGNFLLSTTDRAEQCSYLYVGCSSFVYFSTPQLVSLWVLKYRQSVLWMLKKCSCANNALKIRWHKFTKRVGLWVSLLIVTVRNLKCGHLWVVLFRCIIILFSTAKYEQNCEEATENFSNFPFCIISKCNSCSAVLL